MESHYLVSISRKTKDYSGKYYYDGFLTVRILKFDNIKEKLEILKEKFPKSEGYKISAIFWETLGYHVDLDNKYDLVPSSEPIK